VSGSRYDAPPRDKSGVLIAVGDHVFVPQGTSYRTTYPGKGGTRERTRTQRVTVARIDRYESGLHEVVWQGSGYYWFWCRAADVEKKL
jgi:hypothetical protein